MKSIANFLIRSAGVDQEGARQVSNSEVIKYESLGIIVCCTALFAFLSSLFALLLVFEDLPEYVAALAALLWGLTIYAIDRFFLTTMVHTAGPKRLLLSLPRLAAAIIIGLVISHPIKLAFFDDNIDKEIANQRRDALVEVESSPALVRLNGEIASINAAMDDIDPNKSGQSLSAKLEESRKLGNWLASLQRDLDHRKDLVRFEKEGRVTKVPLSDEKIIESTGRSGCGPVCREHEVEIKRIENAIAATESNIKGLEREISAAKDTDVFSRGQGKDLVTRLSDSYSKIEGVRSGVSAEIPNDFTARSKIIFELMENDAALWYVGFFLTLLFVSIEALPVLAKIVSGTSAYEVRLLEEERAAIVRTRITMRKQSAELIARAEIERGVSELRARNAQLLAEDDPRAMPYDKFEVLCARLLGTTPPASGTSPGVSSPI